ncbi:hypothetical protein DFH09DRAFT_1274049 [Mycena vulgaris]|nr:hypothetical protein DFH09DRAFT_1274049 [Mycena vulgaris]
MSFALNGTQISGGTFNNVSGNMSQVVHSHSVLVGAPAGQRLINGGQGLHSMQRGDSFGVVRPPREERQSRISQRPYGAREPISSGERRIQTRADIPNRGLRHAIQDVGPSSMNHDGILSGDSYADHMPLDNYRIMSGGTSYDGPSRADAGPRESIPNHIFNSIGGDMTQVSLTSYGESGIDILYRSVAMAALHNSGERFPEPACHPGTRISILEDLRTWSLDTSPGSSLLWLHGSAGVGKSAIAQMFAGDCQTQNQLGASFFFKRGHPTRGTWNRLFTTVSYQLATSVSGLFLPIQQAVERDKLIVGRSLAVQFQQLLLEPLRNAPAPHFLPIIVLDGLDECENPKIQQQILRLFIGALRLGQLPIRILIVSRPESHLREVLETEETFAICRHSNISTDKSALEDIRTYLRDEFLRIHSEYTARGINLGAEWPVPEVLDHLVKKSSGIFIYAATVIRFVDDEYSPATIITPRPPHPMDRLESVLRLDSKSTAPLDDLYTQILSVLPQEPQQLHILHAVWRSTLFRGLSMDPEEIDMLLKLRPGTSRLVLRGLHSLFEVPPIRPRRLSLQWSSITFLHASFADYLGDKHRSGGWCVSILWLRTDYLHSMIGLLSAPLPSASRVRGLYRDVVESLPLALRDVESPETLVTSLRSQAFQDSLFLNVDDIPSWPQRDSPYPADLIQLWEDHSFISELVLPLTQKKSSQQGRSTTSNFHCYTVILTRYPDIFFVLRALQIGLGLGSILRLSGLTCRIFQPFLEFREFLDLPFPNGGSPLDFLADPLEAGELYHDFQDIAEEMLLFWISRAKEVLSGNSDLWLICIEKCSTSTRLLRELESLNLSQLCDEHAADRDSHSYAHEELLHPDHLRPIMDWLWDLLKHRKRKILGKSGHFSASERDVDWKIAPLSADRIASTAVRDGHFSATLAPFNESLVDVPGDNYGRGEDYTE